ncbi:hypothetical protein [Rathayibacter tritici]|uniref:hypothetical protein n=1 Tax=Rathayibacter tritici TaxID=33888 RepID=UPI0012FB47CC|nr:hypothetical protein [Rathayibacter tritici]
MSNLRAVAHERLAAEKSEDFGHRYHAIEALESLRSGAQNPDLVLREYFSSESLDFLVSAEGLAELEKWFETFALSLVSMRRLELRRRRGAILEPGDWQVAILGLEEIISLLAERLEAIVGAEGALAPETAENMNSKRSARLRMLGNHASKG